MRTPLSALSGEVALALRRERSPDAYREALARIADRVTELLDFTGDLAVLARPGDPGTLPTRTASLRAALAAVRERYSGTAGATVAIDDAAARVAGDEQPLVRALTLLMDHAVRHRGESPGIFLCSAPPPEDGHAAWVDLLLSAAPPGFTSGAWVHLRASSAAEDRPYASGLVRLRTAWRLVIDCGGSLDVMAVDGVESLRIRLRRV